MPQYINLASNTVLDSTPLVVILSLRPKAIAKLAEGDV